MRLLPQTPLDWVLLAVAAATGVIIFLALQDVAFAVVHFGGLLLGSAGPRWAVAGIAVATLLFLSALESARRVQLPRTLVDDPMPKALLTSGPFALVRHPCYIAYSLAWLAAPVAMHSVPLGLTAVFMIVCYILSAREEERRLIPFIY